MKRAFAAAILLVACDGSVQPTQCQEHGFHPAVEAWQIKCNDPRQDLVVTEGRMYCRCKPEQPK